MKGESTAFHQDGFLTHISDLRDQLDCSCCSRMVICGSSDEANAKMRRIEKVKFGVPIVESFSRDIPPTLLVLLIKLNKEGQQKKDIWRAPGNVSHVRKLVHMMAQGRLVNVDNFSAYTAASVIKKFLAKVPGGIFGEDNEARLFRSLDQSEPMKRSEAICRVVETLPVTVQHLLVLLFGTFRLVADAALNTRMPAEAIGVSVAPSLFHTCIPEGQRAKLDDVVRFRMASQVVGFLITNFGQMKLLPLENYEYYGRLTGRFMQVDRENFRCSFRSHFFRPGDPAERPSHVRFPSCDPQHPRVSIRLSAACSQSNLVTSTDEEFSTGDYDSRYDRYTNCTFGQQPAAMSLEELKRINFAADSTKSLSFLNEVHERQAQRMQNRSEWFLTPSPGLSSRAFEFKSLDSALNQQPFSDSDADISGRSASGRSAAASGNSGVTRRRSSRKHYSRLQESTSNTPPLGTPPTHEVVTIRVAQQRNSAKKRDKSGGNFDVGFTPGRRATAPTIFQPLSSPTSSHSQTVRSLKYGKDTRPHPTVSLATHDGAAGSSAGRTAKVHNANESSVADQFHQDLHL